jgi:hypothetical protein
MQLAPGSHILTRGLEILLIDDEIIELNNVFLVSVHLFRIVMPFLPAVVMP